MKIITDNAAYIQKNDLAYLTHTDLAIPESIFRKIFEKGIVIINDSNRYEFIKFEEASAIEFFSNIDWMIDYNSLKDLTDGEIIKMGQNITKKMATLAQKIDSIPKDDRKAQLDILTEFKNLDFKLNSLKDILLFRQGHLKFKLPEGIEYSQKCQGDIQKLARKFFPKKRHN